MSAVHDALAAVEHSDAMKLAEARAAWRSLKAAESQIARLEAYPRMSPAMRADRAYWCDVRASATTTLTRILGNP